MKTKMGKGKLSLILGGIVCACLGLWGLVALIVFSPYQVAPAVTDAMTISEAQAAFASYNPDLSFSAFTSLITPNFSSFFMAFSVVFLALGAALASSALLKKEAAAGTKVIFSFGVFFGAFAFIGLCMMPLMVKINTMQEGIANVSAVMKASTEMDPALQVVSGLFAGIVSNGLGLHASTILNSIGFALVALFIFTFAFIKETGTDSYKVNVRYLIPEGLLCVVLGAVLPVSHLIEGAAKSQLFNYSALQATPFLAFLFNPANSPLLLALGAAMITYAIVRMGTKNLVGKMVCAAAFLLIYGIFTANIPLVALAAIILFEAVLIEKSTPGMIVTRIHLYIAAALCIMLGIWGLLTITAAIPEVTRNTLATIFTANSKSLSFNENFYHFIISNNFLLIALGCALAAVAVLKNKVKWSVTLLAADGIFTGLLGVLAITCASVAQTIDAAAASIEGGFSIPAGINVALFAIDNQVGFCLGAMIALCCAILLNRHYNPPHQKVKKVARSVSYERFGYLFIAPFFIVFLIFQFYPICFTFWTSVTNAAGWEKVLHNNFVGLTNFKQFFDSSSSTFSFFWGSLGNTVIMWLFNFIPQIGFALLLASWFTDTRIHLKFQGGFKVMIFMPNIITAATIGMLFFSFFSFPIAPINTMLQQMGLLNAPFNFFRNTAASRGLISFIQWWMWCGNTMIIMIAGINGISPSLFEAALVDGCTSRQTFWKITLPLIKPILLYNLVTSLVGGLTMFDIPHLMTQGGPNRTTNTVARFIYTQGFQTPNNFMTASAASVLLFFIIVVCSLILSAIMKDRDVKPNRKFLRGGAGK